MSIPDESDLAKLDFYDGLRTHMLYYTTPSVPFSVEIFHGICYVRTRVIVYGFTAAQARFRAAMVGTL